MDTQYKTRKLRDLEPPSPAIGGLVANTVMKWAPFRAALAAQDAIPATSRRVVAEYGLNGSDEWHVPDDTAGDPNNAGGAQLYPGSDWRVVERQTFRLTPGSMLEAHAMFVGAGTVQKDSGGGFWIHDGAWGKLRVGATWTSADGLSTTGPHYFGFAMAGSGLGTFGGGENTDGAADFMSMQEREIEDIRPPTFASDPAVAALYSEDAEVTVTIELSGAPRVIHSNVYERPLAHVTEHDDAGDVSVHALPSGLAPQTPRPMEKPADGATYEEHRGGTTRMMQVAARQGERLGPRLFGFYAWDEDEAAIWEQTDATPIAITSATFVDIFDTSITTYSADNPGMIIGAAHAQLHRLCDPNMVMRGLAAVVPALVRFDASMSGGTGTIRVQSGLYEWIDVTIGSGARALHEAVGYLESQVHADHAWANVQIFARVTAGTLSIYGGSGDFGRR